MRGRNTQRRESHQARAWNSQLNPYPLHCKIPVASRLMKIPPALANQARRRGNISAARPGAPRLLAARTVRWRGIFAVHTSIVVKKAAHPATAPMITPPRAIQSALICRERRWFGALPETFDRPLEERRAEFENRLAQAVATRTAKRK
jgi:hypothetical protein